jgi:hypothetical protein
MLVKQWGPRSVFLLLSLECLAELGVGAPAVPAARWSLACIVKPFLIISKASFHLSLINDNCHDRFV